MATVLKYSEAQPVVTPYKDEYNGLLVLLDFNDAVCQSKENIDTVIGHIW